MGSDWRRYVGALSSHLETSEKIAALLQQIDAEILRSNLDLGTFLDKYLEAIETLVGFGTAYACYHSTDRSCHAIGNHSSSRDVPAIIETALQLPQKRKSTAKYTLYRFALDAEVEVIFCFVADGSSRTLSANLSRDILSIFRQFEIFVRHKYTTNIRDRENTVYSVFFDLKLQPSRCWELILNSCSLYFPDFLVPDERAFLKQFLLYRKDSNFLRICAGQRTTKSGYILLDRSITGLAVSRNVDKYLLVDPRDYPDRYLAYGNSTATHELVVPLRSDDDIVALLNIERFDDVPFSAAEAFYYHQSSAFLQPMVTALQERYDSYREKEILLLYAITEVLGRLADTFSHLMEQPILEAKDAIYKLSRAAERNTPDLPSIILEQCVDLRSNMTELSRHHRAFLASLPEFVNYGPIDVASLADSRLARFAEKVEAEDIDVDVDAKSDKCVAYGTGLFQEHLFNIVNNAYQSIRQSRKRPKRSSRGQINVAINRIPGKTEHDRETGLDYIEVIVSDNGGGAPKAILRNIGQPGFTTKGEHGTGFGMRSAKEYCESLGGAMSWENIYTGKRRMGFQVTMILQAYDETVQTGDDLPKSLRAGAR